MAAGASEISKRSGRKISGNRVALIVAAILLTGALLSYSAAMRQAPTFDEPLHAAAGYLIRFSDDYRLDIEDPALFSLLSSIPQTAHDLRVDPHDPGLTSFLSNHNQQWDLVIRTMFRTPTPDGKSVYSGVGYINRARAVFVLISVLLGALVARWAYLLGGASAAIIAAGLYAFDPNFMAHGPLVKNDVLISLLMLWLMYALWRLGQQVTVARIISIALACAIAVNVKFSGLFFGSLLLAGVLIRALMSTPWKLPGRELNTRMSRVIFAALICFGVGIFCWASIWSVYRFRFSMARDPSVRFDRRSVELGLKAELLGRDGVHEFTIEQLEAYPLPLTVRAAMWLDDHKLLPDGWLYGFLYTYAASLQRHAFLLGEHSLTGWWYYFPLAMLFKTPIAVLVGMGLLVVKWAIDLQRAGRVLPPSWDSICLWLAIVLYGAAAMGMNLNLGIRHILPLYPFIYILMATALARWRRNSTLYLAIVLVVGATTESLVSWPHEISFFNVASGSARGGIRLLGDSNLDWGQDLPLVAQWQQKHPDVPLYLAYFGSTDPHAYGIHYLNVAGGYPFSDQQPAPLTAPGVFAISATFLQGTYSTDQSVRYVKYLRARHSREVLGGSIYLFDFSPAEFDAFNASYP